MAIVERERSTAEAARRRSRILVRGTVQGVGFRPFVYRLARSLGLGGWVLNSPDGVIIEVEGGGAEVAAFPHRLRSDLPPLARITFLEQSAVLPEGAREFVIRESQDGARPTALIPADVATCERCAAEVSDPADRRYRYPFTNCTDCGPRFTIVETVPYDRSRTTMRRFEMCPQCREEYEDPLSRRFHAEPNACPECGPTIWFSPSPSTGRPAITVRPADWEGSDEALGRVVELLRRGRIVAIKGLGGFHLACDARNSEAVRRLRAAKRRQSKPFALMVRDTREASRHCYLSGAEQEALEAAERPILLLRARKGHRLAPEVAPGQRSLGIMLPYTPLHRMLLEAGPAALVMTSGNLSEEPIAHDNDEAAARLGSMADAFLFHDRPIHTPCDDSVARVFRGRTLLLRRSRGFVPRPVRLPRPQAAVLGCGGEQKNTFCLARADEAILSQHVGDLDNAETLDYYGRAVSHFRELFRTVPQVVAHDLHPEYLSYRYALEAAGQGSRAIGVQHHHAHIASCMADNELDGPVIGAAFDGTGYGTDGTLWGGEVLLADYRRFRRAAHLRPVRLPGGEAAIRRPARMAFAYLLDAFPEAEAEEIARRWLPGLSDAERAAVAWQVRTGTNSPFTSGAGRLFDAVSALLGICDCADYEGQAAVELETVAGEMDGAPYLYAFGDGAGAWVLDLRPTIRAIVRDRSAGVPVQCIAARFHATVAEVIVMACHLLAHEAGLERVCLSGGTFQNMRLLAGVVKGLEREGLQVFWHRQVPPNDGGLSLGQAVVAGAVLAEEEGS